MDQQHPLDLVATSPLESKTPIPELLYVRVYDPAFYVIELTGAVVPKSYLSAGRAKRLPSAAHIPLSRQPADKLV